MCVVALALGAHPDFPVILLGNRDEFHARPAAPIHAWDDGSGIIAGRDLQAGGTWLGVHPASGRIAVVTNVRGDAPDLAKASRGALVTQMLSGHGPYSMPEAKQLDEFNAFNLMIVDPASRHDGEFGGGARILTNRPHPEIRLIKSGVVALANQPAFTPCARAERLRMSLQDCADSGSDPVALLDTLTLRDDPALFIAADFYGTRASTLVTQDHNGAISILERRYEAGGHSLGMTALESLTG